MLNSCFQFFTLSCIHTLCHVTLHVFSPSEGYAAVLLNFELVHMMMTWVQTTLYLFPFFRLPPPFLQHVESWLPDQGLNLCLLQWKHGVLPTGLTSSLGLMRLPVLHSLFTLL